MLGAAQDLARVCPGAPGRRGGWLACALLALAAPGLSRGAAQDVDGPAIPLEVTLWREDESAFFAARLSAFFDDHRERLRDGMRHVVEARVLLLDAASERRLGSYIRRCELTWDAWHDAFRVEVLAPELISLGLVDGPRMEAACLDVERGELGVPPIVPERVIVRVVVDLDPPTADVIHGVRSWLIRPDGVEQWLPDFFGSIAALFVSRTSFVGPHEPWVAVSAEAWP